MIFISHPKIYLKTIYTRESIEFEDEEIKKKIHDQSILILHFHHLIAGIDDLDEASHGTN